MLNLPNTLTLSRIILVIVYTIALAWDGSKSPLINEVSGGWFEPVSMTACIALWAFVVAAITDFFDGYLARKYNMVTDFGKLMDPLADKFLVFGAMLGILVYCADLRPIFVWAAAIVMLRELAVTSLRLLAASQSGAVIAAAWLGKVKTVTQVVCILCVILEPVILPFPLFTQYHLLSYVTIAAMIVMTIWSGVEYFAAYGKNINMK